MPPTLPEFIGKYKVERFIESGGMGDVYLARDPMLDRPVAIKFLREGFDSDEMRERFEREARAAGRLSHPNIVTIYEFGEFLRRPFIAMEFVRGEPLSKLVKRREPIPLVRKLEMMEGLCSGLGHAHKAGIIHRDIKPANLMVDADGPLKILDFGIVRMAGSGLTFSGVLVGTVNYMSPEQIAGSSAIDHRSDVFAVGSVLYEVFTYQRAFPGEMADVLYKIVHTQPQPPAALAPGLDPAIVRMIEQCLDKAPERRYQDLGVLRRDLARIRQRYELEDQETYGHSALAVRPYGGTPSSHPGVPSGPGTTRPATPAEQERQRQAVEAERLRVQQAERARLEREQAEQAERDRIARERAEQAERGRIARERAEQAERDRIAREQAEQAERARIAREQAEQIERARIAREQAENAERERLARERAEQAERERLARDQAEKVEQAERAERARIAREQAEQARLEEARKAREEAERKRAEEQRRAKLEAERQAELRRQQRQQAIVAAGGAVAAGRYADAVEQLRPWAGEPAGDPAFAALLAEAQAGVDRLEAERRRQEALARQVSMASELLVRQDLDGAARLLQQVLDAQPDHAGAIALQREVARARDLRTRAAAAAESARAVFETSPGDALEALERFTPSHALVDAALQELRARHAARQKERRRLEAQERRRQAIGAIAGRAGDAARSRAVQGLAAALLVAVIGFASWRALRTGTAEPPTSAPAANPSGTPVDAGQPKPAEPIVQPATPASQPPPDPTAAGRDTTAPAAGASRPGTESTAAAGRREPPATRTSPNAGTPATDRPAVQDPRVRETGGNPIAGREDPRGATPPAPSPGDKAAATETPKTASAEPAPKPSAPEPAPPPREAPAAPNPVAVAKAEIHQWMAAYQQAYRALDRSRVREMNRKATLSSMLSSASVQFSDVQIDVEPDGQSAMLRATVRYDYTWQRSGPPVTTSAISWPMRKVGSAWIAYY